MTVSISKQRNKFAKNPEMTLSPDNHADFSVYNVISPSKRIRQSLIPRTACQPHFWVQFAISSMLLKHIAVAVTLDNRFLRQRLGHKIEIERE